MKNEKDIKVVLKGIEVALKLHQEEKGSHYDVTRSAVLESEVALLKWILEKK